MPNFNQNIIYLDNNQANRYKPPDTLSRQLTQKTNGSQLENPLNTFTISHEESNNDLRITGVQSAMDKRFNKQETQNNKALPRL